MNTNERKLRGTIRKYKNARHNWIGTLSVAFNNAPHREARDKISAAFKRACNTASPAAVDHNFQKWESQLLQEEGGPTYVEYKSAMVQQALIVQEYLGEHVLPLVCIKDQAEFDRFTGGLDA